MQSYINKHNNNETHHSCAVCKLYEKVAAVLCGVMGCEEPRAEQGPCVQTKSEGDI